MQAGEELSIDELASNLSTYKEQLQQVKMLLVDEPGNSEYEDMAKELAEVLKESFKVYCAVNDGIINLVDNFFEMPRHDTIKALEIYKRAGQQARSLSDFFEICKGLELSRNFQFPVLREPPQSFLATMEEYVREAPSIVIVPS